MSDDFESGFPAEARPSLKQRWLVVALLLTVTLGGTWAMRLAAKTTASDQGIPGTGLMHQVRSELLRFEGRLDRGAVHVGSDGLVHLELVATGAERPDRKLLRRPTDVVVVLDSSGSMSGDPMNKALAAIHELVTQLASDDRFALVTYSNGAAVAVPLEAASSAARSRWASVLTSIPVGGGTNMASGLDRAHELVAASRAAGRVARVMLLSDGHANQGDSSPEGLSRRSARALQGEYVLSTVGVGEGFDERLMSRLADAGTGNFYYVPDVEILAGIFSDEFESARQTIASRLEIRIEKPDGIEVLEAAGYPLEDRGGEVVIRPGSLYAGQTRSFWVTLRVPAKAAGEFRLGNVSLAYETVDGERREARLPRFAPVAAVVDESTFVARLDKGAVQKHHAEDLVNRVAQSVSSLVAGGDYDSARDALADVDFSELEALGYVAEETKSFEVIQKMKKEVDRAAAAPAVEQHRVRSELGKSLYESGTDGRRKGAKRQASPGE